MDEYLDQVPVHDVKMSPSEPHPDYIPLVTDLQSHPPITSKDQLRNMYPECFNGIGKFKNYEYHITLVDNAKPVIHPARKVALSLQPKLKKELESLVEQGIITPVEGPTDWVNSLVVREKPDGRLRICLDPKDLNRAIKREHHPIPSIDDILPRLVGATKFTKLDSTQAFLNVPLDYESSLLTTFNTPWGRLRFLRMPFGLKMSQDIFQRKIDQAFKNCMGAVGIADDIQVFGNDQNHDLHLHKAMERTRKAGIKLNYNKCTVSSKNCSFFGNIYTPQGVTPDPKKVQAIKQMQAPSMKQELQSFIGMVNYLSQFIPSMSELTTPLRKLLKRDILFQWTESHEEAFRKLKDSISSDVCLQYFDPAKPVRLQVDASKVGLGAVLIQNDPIGKGKPIAFVSKSLTPVETRYANIEHEMLAVVFGCMKFHHYLYGRRFICESDHKPLEDIHLKHLSDAPPRLQRLLLKIQPYDFSIKYIPGKDIPMADALSRVSPYEKVKIKGLDVTIHELTPQLTRVQVQTIQKATQEDSTLQLLIQQILKGWPDHCRKLPEILKPYWQYREDLAIEHSCITWKGRFFIPLSLRDTCLKALHNGHPGVSKMILRAQSSMYCPSITKHIAEYVHKCAPCQTISNSQQKEPAIPIEVPSRSWKLLGMDLFMHKSNWYLIVADYYSKYPYVMKMSATSSKNVISALSFCFSVLGTPEEIICDNTTYFTSRECKEFAEIWGFAITTSSPHYPKGHGFIKRQVQTIEKLFTRYDQDGINYQLALQELRATPIDCNLQSPAELLFGRQLKTTLLVIIKPPANSEAVRASLQSRQDYSRYDAHAKEKSSLLPTQLIWVEDSTTKGKWHPGVVKSQTETPHSYIVETQQGEYRRN